MKHWLALLVLATVSLLLYAHIASQSQRFSDTVNPMDRPILSVLGGFACTFAIYLATIPLAARLPESRSTVLFILSSSIVFRMIMLGSTPILEIDIYRYLWDGAVVANGESPFRYSPEQVLNAPTDERLPDDLRKLVELRDNQPELNSILRRIHFGFLPTIYPPVSQSVFGIAVFVTPENASVDRRLVTMKAIFVGFDLLTLGVVIAILKSAGRPVGLSLIYGWCPLLMKEVANSGHLDAIAVFLTAIAVYFLAISIFPRQKRSFAARNQGLFCSLAMVCLAMGVGAKLYPIVLLPLFLTAIATASDNWQRSVTSTIVFAITTLVVFLPMYWTAHRPNSEANVLETGDTVDPTDGIEVFLRNWEMNDFVFLILIENLTPDSQVTAETQAWFTVLPNSFRDGLTNRMGRFLKLPPEQVPFLIARLITGFAYLLVLSWLVLGVQGDGSLQAWLRSVFLAIAWFWLLCPTQNPWYWTWAMPFLAFARCRAWLMLSGIVFVYYLRFWFSAHGAESTIGWTSYRGVNYFDFVVTWLEFAPWFALLAIESWSKRRCGSARTAIS